MLLIVAHSKISQTFICQGLELNRLVLYLNWGFNRLQQYLQCFTFCAALKSINREQMFYFIFKLHAR